jgi:hypothetical protein
MIRENEEFMKTLTICHPGESQDPNTTGSIIKVVDASEYRYDSISVETGPRLSPG